MAAKSSSAQRLLWEGISLALISSGTLCFEINLTRLFSVSQFYHFAFMVVSMALLGYGVSGTVLSLIQNWGDKRNEGDFSFLSACSALSMLASFLLVNKLPFDSFSIFADPTQLGILFLHYLMLSSPFFFSGMIISLMLSKYESQSGTVYGLNLAGSAMGCLLAVVSPVFVDGEGVVAFSAAVCCIAGLIFLFGKKTVRPKSYRKKIINLILIGLTLILTLVPILSRLVTGEMPGYFTLTISPYKSLSYALQSPGAKIFSSQWNSISRVDVVKSPSLHSIPGLSYRYLEALPSIEGLFIDGDNLNAILPQDDPLKFSDHLQFSIAYQLHKKPDVLIIGPKGGLELLAADEMGAHRITAVEDNPLVIEAASHPYEKSGVNLVLSSGRSFLRGSDQKFDIVQLPLTDSYHPVSSGAYSLGEDFRYTIQAFEDAIDLLKPEGILVVTRWLQEVPSECLRTYILAVTASEEKGLDPRENIIAIRGYNTGTLLVKKSPFTMDEISRIKSFAQDKAFDLVSMPNLTEKEVNQYNILQEPIYYQSFKAFLRSENREDFFETYPYDVTPPSDDHPFFGHYFKWSQMDEILDSMGETWQPFGGAGYLVILIIFALALVFSGGLISLPWMVRKNGDETSRSIKFPGYFAAIGLAFMLVEMPLIQGFILILDQTTYAMAVVLFGILFFSGIGSRFGSQKFSLASALKLLILLLTLYLLVLPIILDSSLELSFVLRLGITIVLIAPLGFLMGIPFAAGLKWIRKDLGENNHHSQWMVSYVWAVNGASSVISSILASLIALSFGFRITLVVGTICYLFAYLISRKNLLPIEIK